MKKRIIALLLVVATLLSMIGAGVPVDTGSDTITTEQVETIVVPTATPEVTVTPEETVVPTETPEATVEPTVTPEPTVANVAAVSEEQEEDNCPYCEETLAEDGTVIHTEICTAAYVYDGTADKGKYVELSAFSMDYGVMVSGSPATDEGIPFYYDEFGADTIMRITDWYWDAGTTGLWYAVELYCGVFPESTEDVVWPKTPWVLQNYTEDWEEAENSLTFLSTCDICGKPNCTVTHVYCDYCEKYDCGKTHVICDTCGKIDCNGVHLLCLACGAENCQETHSFCGYCVEYDCGINHTAELKPAVSAVIAENPIMTEGTAVSIVDEYGDPVTNEGFYLLEGTKASLSAWSDLDKTTGVSYQWQIRYDAINDLWTDIQGQTGKGILISSAMFCALQNEAVIRCASSAGGDTYYSESIPVWIISDQAVTDSYTMTSTYGLSTVAEEGETENTSTKFTLTIHYVLSEQSIYGGRAVANDWTGTYTNDVEQPVTVPHPTVPGYAPVAVEADGVSTTELNRTFPVGQTDLEITVQYAPASVKYQVIHYFQNTNSNNYEEKLSETKYGITEQAVPADLAKPEHDTVKFDGLTNLAYEQPAIAADGSTVIEIYYDRIYYLISFDLGGGYGVGPVFARYGAAMRDVGTPTLVGWTFAGWDLLDATGEGDDVADALPATIPAENRKYRALWTNPQKTKVTVVYWRENADDYGFSVWGTETFEQTHDGNDIEAGMVLDGVNYKTTSMLTSGTEELPYFTLNETKTERAVTVKGDDSTVINVYYNRNVYSVYFYAVAVEVNGRTCGIPEHTHSDEFRTRICTEDHEHDSVTCYSGCRILICTEDHEHHATDCYRYDCGMTVHTHSDGDNCGTVKKMPLVHAITAKYNANISAIWPTPSVMAQLPTVKKNDSGQAANASGTPFRAWQIGTGTATVSRKDTMNSGVCDTEDDVKDAYALYKSSATLQLRYMVRSFDQTSPENRPDRAKIGSYYYDVMSELSQTVVCSDEIPDDESFRLKDIAGLEKNTRELGEQLDDGSYYFYLFYTRKNFILTFKNNGEDFLVKTKVPWGKPLSELGKFSVFDDQGNWVSYGDDIASPTYPIGEEPGTLEFEGWYTTNNFYDGTKYLFEADDTMPAYDLTLFARWVPVIRTVTFYEKYEDIALNKQLPQETHPTITLYNNTTIGTVNDASREGYYFVNWYYRDENGEEHAFDPETMPVTSDLQLYANWTSTVTVEYQVHFRTMIDGEPVAIADSITNKALAGNTVTYSAKVGGALYDGYQTKYFPEFESQSLTLDASETATNELIFWYKAVQTIPYTVKYLNTATNTNVFGETTIPNKVVSNNEKAAVTEDYLPIKGYIPDEARKTLVLIADGNPEQNVLIFYYTESVDEAPVRITHYIQELNGGWKEFDFDELTGTFSTEGNQNSTHTGTKIEISGFTYSKEMTAANQKAQADGTNVTVTADGVSGTLVDYTGLYLDLYYTRNDYPYVVRYVEEGTYKQLANPKEGADVVAPYEKLVTEEALLIDGYKLVSASSQSISIKIESGDTPILNVITFLYERQLGTLQLSKTVTSAGDYSAPEGDAFEFTVQLSGTDGFNQPYYGYGVYNIGDDPTHVAALKQGTATPVAAAGSTVKDRFTVELEAGQYALIKGLPTGTYLFTEADSSDRDYALTVAPPESGIVLNETDTGVVVFTNTYTKRTGDLTVTKTVAKEYKGDTLPEDTFEFTLTLTRETSTKNRDRTYSYTIYDVYGVQVEYSGTVLSTNAEPVVIEFSLKNEERIEFKDLPIGDYTVSETENTAYITTVNGSASGTITATTESTAEFINTYKRTLGDLTITTDGALFDGNDSYIFTVTGPNGYSQKVAINGNNSVTIKDLSYGEYTITPDTSWSWRYGNMGAQIKKIDASTKTVVDETSVNVVEATFTQSVSIKKWLSGSSYAKNLFN